MSSTTSMLAQGLPSQSRLGTKSKFASRAALDSWIEYLPMANVAGTAKQLLQALEELNGAKVGAKFRVQALEAIQNALVTLTPAVERQIMQKPFPLAESALRAHAVSDRLYRLLSLGFRIAAHQAAESNSLPMVGKRQLANAVHHALLNLLRAQYGQALVYQTHDPSLWRSANTLYRFARERGLAAKSARDPWAIYRRDFSIDQLYVRMCLLNLACSNRFTQHSIVLLGRAIEQWCEMASIEAPGADGKATFTVSFDDGPPRYTGAQSGAAASNPALVIDITRLEQHLRQYLANGKPVRMRARGVEALELPATLANRLLEGWGKRPERCSHRLEATHRLVLHESLNGIFAQLAHSRSFVSVLERALELPDFRRHAGLDGDDWRRQFEEPYQHGAASAGVLNQSLGGYRLVMERDTEVHVRVGELVALVASSLAELSEDHWLIAVVRWLHTVGDGRLQLGVELVGRDAVPLVLACGQSTSRVALPFRGLLVRPFAVGEENEPSIILPALVEPGTGPLVGVSAADMQIEPTTLVLTEEVERTSEFARYQFRYESGVEFSSERERLLAIA